jgi:choline-phosphate cytidylyltransferase
VGESPVVTKFINECKYVNGLEVCGVYTSNESLNAVHRFETFDELLKESDAVYIISNPIVHYEQIKAALLRGKHVLCETPISLTMQEKGELHELAKANNCILMDSIKTAYSTAYSRLLLLTKTGKIGKIVSVETTATSLRDIEFLDIEHAWNSLNAWGPTALLPVFQILGTQYKQKKIVSKLFNEELSFDSFTKIDFVYDNAVATVKVGKGVKSEGELIISGTKGYIYVPAPWWKTDYFEIRYENPVDNKRYFYQLDGEGIRYELVAFLKTIETGKYPGYINRDVSDAICSVIEDFYNRKDFIELG